jgi:hypothetical protein
VKTEEPSACGTVKRKVCRIAIARYLPVVPSCVNVEGAINPIIQSKTRLCHPYMWQYLSEYNIFPGNKN